QLSRGLAEEARVVRAERAIAELGDEVAHPRRGAELREVRQLVEDEPTERVALVDRPEVRMDHEEHVAERVVLCKHRTRDDAEERTALPREQSRVTDGSERALED